MSCFPIPPPSARYSVFLCTKLKRVGGGGVCCDVWSVLCFGVVVRCGWGCGREGVEERLLFLDGALENGWKSVLMGACVCDLVPLIVINTLVIVYELVLG